jgi:hypothetical protein
MNKTEYKISQKIILYIFLNKSDLYVVLVIANNVIFALRIAIGLGIE